MKLVELKEKEFENFAYKNKEFSFHQTKEWAKLKACNGWKHLYLGLIDKEIEAATLILIKSTPIKKDIWYSPRGFLIDYDNKKLLQEFTEKIKEYAKHHNAFFIKIDPYLSYKERNINGDLVNGGKDNTKAVENLKSLGYKHYGFNKGTDKELQPRWIYVLDIDGKSEDEIYKGFNSDTKRYINRCKTYGLITEETKEDNIEDFVKIMEHTSKRRGFTDRPVSYYKEMLENLKEHIKIISCYMDTKKALKDIKEKLDEIDKEKKEIEEKLKINPDSKKSKTAMKVITKRIEDINKRKEEIKKLEKENGNKILMASSMFIIYPNEIIYLFSGSFDKHMKYNPQYLIQWEIIKYACEKKIPRYNFYGIDGDFSKDNPMYGVYEFKKGFGGKVVELIGEFDLVINKFDYDLYKAAFKIYRNIKRHKA